MTHPVWLDEVEEEDEERKPLTPSAVRMQRKRRREHKACVYWAFRLRTGTKLPGLIEETLEKAPGIVEKMRLAVMGELVEFAEAYPDRCAPVGRNPQSVTKIK